MIQKYNKVVDELAQLKISYGREKEQIIAEHQTQMQQSNEKQQQDKEAVSKALSEQIAKLFKEKMDKEKALA